MDSEARPDSATISDKIEEAFRYRGDVTVELVDGERVAGFLYNRNANCGAPFVQLFETGTGREINVPYRCIAQIRLTGRDAAAASARRFEDSQRQ